ADASCALCPTLQQSIAENFVVTTGAPDNAIIQITIWGGYYPENIPNSLDDFTFIIHSDAGGPGAVVDTRTGIEATSRSTTGTVLFGCDEYVFTFDFSADPIFLANNGTYWLELYNNSVESGNFFWETGNLDVTHGVAGSGWTTTTPGVTWNLDPATDLSAQISGEIIPVELVSFEASVSGGKVNLNWSTATETNNRGFSIERSSGSEFETIGFVNGSGTTTERRSYSFTDDNVLSGTYTYRLKQIDFDGTFQYSNGVEVNVFSAKDFTLTQNFPNPFNPTTTIEYGLQTKSNVKITVLNSIGQEVALLVNESKEAGYHQVQFNAVNMPSGVYFYRIQAGNFTDTKKMILLK
ncbi:MAG TPA: T9SS type A sorting domain-containing protein, partial [Ignavibacteriaceae bacterium]